LPITTAQQKRWLQGQYRGSGKKNVAEKTVEKKPQKIQAIKELTHARQRTRVDRSNRGNKTQCLSIAWQRRDYTLLKFSENEMRMHLKIYEKIIMHTIHFLKQR